MKIVSYTKIVLLILMMQPVISIQATLSDFFSPRKVLSTIEDTARTITRNPFLTGAILFKTGITLNFLNNCQQHWRNDYSLREQLHESLTNKTSLALYAACISGYVYCLYRHAQPAVYEEELIAYKDSLVKKLALQEPLTPPITEDIATYRTHATEYINFLKRSNTLMKDIAHTDGLFIGANSLYLTVRGIKSLIETRELDESLKILTGSAGLYLGYYILSSYAQRNTWDSLLHEKYQRTVAHTKEVEDLFKRIQNSTTSRFTSTPLDPINE